MRYSPLLFVLAACVGGDGPPESAGCSGTADHCITIGDDGSIDQDDVEISAGESVEFVLGNRWQSVVEITDATDPAACDGPELEVSYDAGSGLTGPMPRLAGGVVVRGTPDGDYRFPDAVWENEAVSGVLLVIPWRDVEPADGDYQLDVFTDALTQATHHGKLVSIGIQAGGKSPAWLFEEPVDVPHTVMTTAAASGNNCFVDPHPHFWEAEYVEQLTQVQTAIADAVKAHGGAYRHVDKIKISGVNLLTSETRMPVDRETPCGNQGETTDDLPVVWAAAGYTPLLMSGYFEALWAEQLLLFPDKDINLMEINRAFPNIDNNGDVQQGFADPEHVRALIEQSIEDVPERFVVLNAALRADNEPQDTCMMAWDMGAGQVGFQTVNGLEGWSDLEPVLVNALGATTPDGATPVSFVEVYESTAAATVAEGHTDELLGYDEVLRARSGLPNDHGETHIVEGLDAGTYAYKIAGTAMTSGACHTGTIRVL